MRDPNYSQYGLRWWVDDEGDITFESEGEQNYITEIDLKDMLAAIKDKEGSRHA